MALDGDCGVERLSLCLSNRDSRDAALRALPGNDTLRDRISAPSWFDGRERCSLLTMRASRDWLLAAAGSGSLL